MTVKIFEGRIRMNKLENYILMQARTKAKSLGITEDGVSAAFQRVADYCHRSAPKADAKYLETTRKDGNLNGEGKE